MDQAESLRNQMRALHAAPGAAGPRVVAVMGPVDPDWQSWFCRAFADAWARAGGRACVAKTRDDSVEASNALASPEVSAADLWVIDCSAPSTACAIPGAAEEVLLLTTPSAQSVKETYVYLTRLARHPSVKQVGLVVGQARRLVEARHIAAGLQQASVEHLDRPLTIVGYVLEPRPAAPAGEPCLAADAAALTCSCFDQLVANYRRARRLTPGCCGAKAGRGR